MLTDLNDADFAIAWEAMTQFAENGADFDGESERKDLLAIEALLDRFDAEALRRQGIEKN